ncbi:hypothetical protein RUND412_003759 [Rhizina undulata]
MLILIIYLLSCTLLHLSSTNPNARPSAPVKENALGRFISSASFIYLAKMFISLRVLFIVVMFLLETHPNLLPIAVEPSTLCAIVPRPSFSKLPLKNYVGLTLIISGSILRLLCFRQLGDSFTFRLSVPRNGLVKTGMYKYVKHPSYTGIIAITVGTALAEMGPTSATSCFFTRAMDWWVFVGWLAFSGGMTAIFLGKRVREEENILKKTFGREWEVYAGESKKFIPGIW